MRTVRASGKLRTMAAELTCGSESTFWRSWVRSSPIRVASGAIERVLASHVLSSTPSVTRTKLFTRSDFAASGIESGLSLRTAATSHAPQQTPAITAAPIAARIEPIAILRRPSPDIARGRTCWGMSFQLRVSGRVWVSLLKGGVPLRPVESAQPLAKPSHEPVP